VTKLWTGVDKRTTSRSAGKEIFRTAVLVRFREKGIPFQALLSVFLLVITDTRHGFVACFAENKLRNQSQEKRRVNDDP